MEIIWTLAAYVVWAYADERSLVLKKGFSLNSTHVNVVLLTAMMKEQLGEEYGNHNRSEIEKVTEGIGMHWTVSEHDATEMRTSCFTSRHSKLT